MAGPTLQDVFATVRDPMEVQKELIAQQQQIFAQMQNPTQQFGAGLAQVGLNLARRFKTGHKGNGFIHRLRTGEPTAPEVARAQHTQEAVDRATNAAGTKREDESDQDFEIRLLENMRNELQGEQYSPETRQAVAARYSALLSERYERSRLEESDEMARDKFRRDARLADINEQLAGLKLEQEQRTARSGESEFWVFQLPDGSTVDRREDSPEADRITENGGLALGTRHQLRQAELERERIAASNEPNPARLSNTQIEGISALSDLTRQTLRADGALGQLVAAGDGPFSGTGIIPSWFGIRDWLVEKTDWLDGDAESDAWRTFQDAERQMRPLFQQIANGNPSDRENEYFTRAVFDTKKGVAYNRTIIDGLMGMYADRAKLIYSTALQNRQPVPPELITLMRTLGVDPASVDASFNMADLDAATQARLDALDRAGGAPVSNSSPRSTPPTTSDLTPEDEALMQRLLAQ